MYLVQSFVRKSVSFFLFSALFSLAVTSVSAQQSQPNAGQATAPGATATPAPAMPKPETTIPGLDTKTMTPLYETIQEDWSSLQIGTSKLEPQTPILGAVEEHDTFTRLASRLQWRPGDPVDVTIIMPKGVKNPPAVIYLYGPGEGDDSARFRDDRWAQRVTSQGVAAVGFIPALVGPRFRNRPMKQWYISEMQESLGSTVHDVKFVLDYMAKTNQFDMDRVGMFGQGYGGAIAILAAAADVRIKAVDALDPWGDWPDFLAKSQAVEPAPNHEDFVKPEFLKKVAPLDPVKWLPELKTPIRIQQVRENLDVPDECKDAIKAAAPKQAEVMRFAAYTDMGRRESGGRLFDWVKEKLQKKAEPETSAKLSAGEKTGDSKPAAKK